MTTIYSYLLSQCIKGSPRQSWIPDYRYWIPVPGTCILDSLSCIPDSKAQDSGFSSKIFPDFQIPQAEIFQIHLNGAIFNIYFLKTILLKNALLLDLSIWTTAIEQNYITDLSKSLMDMIYR